MKKQNKISGWEKGLAKLMKKYILPNGDWNIIDGFIPLEDFIRQLLDEQEEEFKRVVEEGCPKHRKEDIRRAVLGGCEACQALSDILKELEKL